MFHIELFESYKNGKKHYGMRLKSSKNGKVIMTSQRYKSRRNRERTIYSLAAWISRTKVLETRYRKV